MRSIHACRLIASIVAVAACTRAESRPSPELILQNLPLDSIARSLGTNVDKYGLSTSAGRDDSPKTGRFRDTYTLAFTSPFDDSTTVHRLEAAIETLTTRRGARISGRSTLNGEAKSFTYETGTAFGEVQVVSLRPREHEPNRYYITIIQTPR